MSESIAINRKAQHDFYFFDKYEAGIELKGSEVKSIRDGRATLQDSYVRIMNGEAFIVNLHIGTYRFTHDFVPPESRTRKLLLKKREIERLAGQTSAKGFVCIPTRLYFKRGFVKMEIALAKKKKDHDKRQVLKEKISKREMDRAMKSQRQSKSHS